MVILISGTIISAGKTVMASEYKGRATVQMGKEVLASKNSFSYPYIQPNVLIFYPKSQKHISFSIFFQGSTLTLILAEEEDAGVYQCR